jgi:hypothetical protein
MKYCKKVVTEPSLLKAIISYLQVTILSSVVSSWDVFEVIWIGVES